MPKNVMKLSKPSPHRARNAFDLSHRRVLDANFGELLPISCIETVPGDTINLNVSDLLRTITFSGSPFLRAKQHLDVWFVPYRDMWHNFEQFITQKTEPVSAALKQSLYLPHTDMTSLYNVHTMNTTQIGGIYPTDIVGRNRSERTPYLWSLLGYGDIPNYSPQSNPNFGLNLFRLAAYNYIWYNEYRQQYYDTGFDPVWSAPDYALAGLFNFDDKQCDTQANSLISDVNRLCSMSQLRYRTWKKDLFTGILPSTQFGAVSIVQNQNSSNYVSIYNINNGSGGVNAAINNGQQLQADGVASSTSWMLLDANGSGSLSSSFDILALRKSEAIQIWRENALRAGNRVKDNMRAHYGVESDFRDHRPTYLGSVSSPLNISDVVATANSNAATSVNTAVGDIAGKGVSSLSEKVFHYKANEFGVIMCIFSILPEAEYEGIGIDRMNQLLEAEDFFIPEYENLGLEAVPTATLHYAFSGSIGYAPRYFGYKTKVDECFGAFTGNGVFRPWTSQRSPYGLIPSTPGQPLNVGALYVNPNTFNRNFNVALDISPQFLCDFYFDVSAVRPMSVTGLPFS